MGRFVLTTNSLSRLREATELLEEMQSAALTRDPNRFRRKANAFLPSLRSMTYMLEADYRKRPGFREWWAEQRTALWADPEWRRFNAMRNIALKDGIVSWEDLGSTDEALSFFERQQHKIEQLTRNAFLRFG